MSPWWALLPVGVVVALLLVACLASPFDNQGPW